MTLRVGSDRNRYLGAPTEVDGEADRSEVRLLLLADAGWPSFGTF